MSSLRRSVRRLATLMFLTATGTSVATAAAGCGKSDTPSDNTALNGDAGATSGTATVTGTYGTEPIRPVQSAIWIGLPDDPAEAAGGPFIYLFGDKVTCNDLSKANKWGDAIPAGTQVLELIVGTTKTSVAAPAAANAAANVSEVNYIHGGNPDDTRATSGTVTLTSYAKDVAVDGTFDVKFPTGDAKGTFHATWCPGGHEH